MKTKPDSEQKIQPHYPPTEGDWTRALCLLQRDFADSSYGKPPKLFFSKAVKLYDGHLLLAGQGIEPLYLIVVVLGPLAAPSLADFFMHQSPGFLEIRCWGDPDKALPWSAAGALPAAAVLNQKQRSLMVGLIRTLVLELMERLAKQQMKN